MGKVAGAQRFDGQNWYKQHIARRTREALDEQDRAFAVRHAESTLTELACYLRRCAEHWGRSPAPCEIVGGSYIAERFTGGTSEYDIQEVEQPNQRPVSARDEAPSRVVPNRTRCQTGGTSQERTGAPAQCRKGVAKERHPRLRRF